jgi:hypothetical protein
MSNNVLLTTFAGRESGKVYTLPLGYVRLAIRSTSPSIVPLTRTSVAGKAEPALP